MCGGGGFDITKLLWVNVREDICIRPVKYKTLTNEAGDVNDGDGSAFVERGLVSGLWYGWYERHFPIRRADDLAKGSINNGSKGL